MVRSLQRRNTFSQRVRRTRTGSIVPTSVLEKRYFGTSVGVWLVVGIVALALGGDAILG